MDKGLPPKSAILVAAIDPNRHGGWGEPSYLMDIRAAELKESVT